MVTNNLTANDRDKVPMESVAGFQEGCQPRKVKILVKKGAMNQPVSKSSKQVGGTSKREKED